MVKIATGVILVILFTTLTSASFEVTISAWAKQQQQDAVSASTVSSNPTNSTQQNLLTYQNSSLGVNFQYPSNWVKQPPTSTGTIIKLVSPNKSTFTLSVRNLNNTHLNSTALLSISAHVMTQVFNKVFHMHPIETSPTTLAGNPAEKLVSTLQVPQLGGFKQMNILFIKGQKEFIISYGSSTATYPVDLPVAQHVIDSFQITK
jgi:PsbP-like protein